MAPCDVPGDEELIEKQGKTLCVVRATDKTILYLRIRQKALFISR